MKKKGFTLIELLAVIVILAIITIIAVPKILDVIEKSRRSASEQSVKLYVDAFRLYQANADLNNTDKIPEGTYEVSKETTLNGKTYKKINDLLTMKGNKPSAGTINVTNTGKIGTAKVCINNYVISYQEGSTSILADDCGDMDLFVDFKINTDEWATEKTLVITYPEKQGYKKYFKVESGSVFIGEKEVTSESAQEVTEKEITLKLKENSKVSAWLEKNSKKAGISTYEEKKIDNEELVEPTITLTGSYPILTEYGVQMSVSLKLSNETNKASKIMYRVDNGEFKEYTGEINITGSKIYAKTVKTINGRESSIAEKDMSNVELAKDALEATAYDGNEETYSQMYLEGGSGSIARYLMVDKSMRGKNIIISRSTSWYASITATFLDNENNEISTATVVDADVYATSGKVTISIPENAYKIKFILKTRDAGANARLREIYVDTTPSFSASSYYPRMSSTVIAPGYQMISINYFSTTIKKYYKIDDGEWIDYNNEKIKVVLDSTIYAKGVDKNGNETYVASYVSSISDALEYAAFDGNEETYSQMYLEGSSGSIARYLMVDKSMRGKNIIISRSTSWYASITATFLDNENNEISTATVVDTDVYVTSGKVTINIPENAYKIKFILKTRDSGANARLREIYLPE